MAGSDVKAESNNTNNGTSNTTEASPAAARPKRVRTGCLTCRERHLKCDEGLPNCQNCRKSGRTCKRGVRLNFIDTQVRLPPTIPPTHEWNVNFLDESRDIASEYKGGLGRYSAVEQSAPAAQLNADSMIDHNPNGLPPRAPSMSNQSLPPMQGGYTDYSLSDHGGRDSHRHSLSASDTASFATLPHSGNNAYNAEQTLTPPSEQPRDYLSTAEETLFMQVFVEEVGLWMDSMDPMKHFSQLLPFHALGEPMLMNAFLACGARHLTLVNPTYGEDKALHYYDTATRGLLTSLQNPSRDTVICATTAVILNVYEIMSERALQRMNHIAGARALIKECGWSARSTGIGAACFWLNVGMELLSCLHFNWQVAWDPDDWGVNMDFTKDCEPGKEEIWTYRIIYIVAKIANFRATIPRFKEKTVHEDQMRMQARYAEWKRLKDWCESWEEMIPRTMSPLAYLQPRETHNHSSFPEVWLIKRSTITARLFFHTAMCLLSQICPVMSVEQPEMYDMQNAHSRQICGIVAHCKDRGVASVALRSLAIAAECLTDRREQEEVLSMFEKIRKETGWKVGFLNKELRQKWKWLPEDTYPAAPPPIQGMPYQGYPPTSLSGVAPPPPQPQQPPPQPAVPRQRPANPLLSADFSSQHPPYQSYYVAPNHHHSAHSHPFG